MSLLIVKIAPLYLLIAMGFLAGRRLQVTKEAAANLLLYIIVPVVVFNSALTAELTIGLAALPITLFLIATVLSIITLTIAKHVWPDATANILGYAAGTGNTGYFGLPVALALFGEPSTNIVVFATMGLIIFENTIGFYMVARGRHTPIEALYKLLRLPSIYTFTLGLLLNGVVTQLPQSYLDFISLFRGSYSLLGMMLIGLGLASVTTWRSIDWKFVSSALLIKFLVWPAIVVSILFLNQWWHLYEPAVAQVLLLLSVVPCAANGITLASVLKVHPEKAAVAVALSTLIALIWIPLCLTLFHFA